MDVGACPLAATSSTAIPHLLSNLYRTLRRFGLRNPNLFVSGAQKPCSLPSEDVLQQPLVDDASLPYFSSFLPPLPVVLRHVSHPYRISFPKFLNNI